MPPKDEMKALLSAAARSPKEAALTTIKWNGIPFDAGEIAEILKSATSDETTDCRCTFCNQVPEGKTKSAMCKTPYCAMCKTPYCSTDCQEADWIHHRLVCKMLAYTYDTPTYKYRKSQGWFLGITMRVSDEKPHLVWWKFEDKRRVAVMVEDSEMAKHAAQSGQANVPMEANIVLYNLVAGQGGRHAGAGIVAMEPFGLTAGRPTINLAIDSLGTPDGVSMFFGTLLFVSVRFKVVNGALFPAGGLDINARVWRFIVDAIVNSPSNPVLFSPTRQLLEDGSAPHRQVLATKVNCIGEASVIARGVRQRFQFVATNARREFDVAPLALAFQMGLPWMVRATSVTHPRGLAEQDHIGKNFLDWVFVRDLVKVGEEESLLKNTWQVQDWSAAVSLTVYHLHPDGVVHPRHVEAFKEYLMEALHMGKEPSKRGFIQFWADWACRFDFAGFVQPYAVGFPFGRAYPEDQVLETEGVTATTVAGLWLSCARKGFKVASGWTEVGRRATYVPDRDVEIPVEGWKAKEGVEVEEEEEEKKEGEE